jgi:hypothetical protein
VTEDEERRRALQAALRPLEERRPGPIATLLRTRLVPTAIVAALLVACIVSATCLGSFAIDQFRITDTVKSFCRAESAGTYDTAYAMFSKRVRQQVSSADVVSAVKNARLMVCTNSQSGHRIEIQNDRTHIAVLYVFGDDVNGTAQDAASMALVREGGGWKINAADSSRLSLP